MIKKCQNVSFLGNTKWQHGLAEPCVLLTISIYIFRVVECLTYINAFFKIDFYSETIDNRVKLLQIFLFEC